MDTEITLQVMDQSRELYLFSSVAALIGVPLLKRNVFNQPEQQTLLQKLHGLHRDHSNVKATRCFRSQNTIIFKWLWLGMVIYLFFEHSSTYRLQPEIRTSPQEV